MKENWVLKHGVTIKRMIAGVGCFVFLAVSAIDMYTQKVEADLKESVIRLHILANSDTYEDQQVKLKVRDRIVREAGHLFEGGDIESARAEILANLGYLEALADDELAKNGCSEQAHASFGVSYFPTKTYKDVSFPAGNYTALRIEIGEGAGQNWWCVLFPPLCFVGVEEPSMGEQSKEELKESMGEEEYLLVTENEDDLPVQFKFKLVELWQEAKNKFGSKD